LLDGSHHLVGLTLNLIQLDSSLLTLLLILTSVLVANTVGIQIISK